MPDGADCGPVETENTRRVAGLLIGLAAVAEIFPDRGNSDADHSLDLFPGARARVES